MSDHYDRYNGMENLLSTNLASLSTDCISRQSAVDALNEYFARIGKLKRRGLTKGEKAIRLDTVGTIKTLPSAEPKRGRWISADAIFGGVPFYCSECGENTRDTVMGKPRWNFCPNCGCRMDGGE